MDGAAFAALKPSAIVVKTALLAPLDAGRLHGFGADVLEADPPIATSVGLHPLSAHPNDFPSPHNAASTEEGLARMARIAAQNTIDCLDGRPDTAMMVNPELALR